MTRTPPRPVRRIGFLLFDGMMALDLVGPMEAFAIANTEHSRANGHPCYELIVIGLRRGDATTVSGLLMKPHVALADCPPLDTLVIPGGEGLRESAGTTALATRWIKQRAPTTRRIASVCTGIYGLAPTGLIDGRRVTTHWRYAGKLAQRFPALRIETDAIHIKDGKFYTSAGITAGIDLALALIEEDLGHAAALQVARELVVYMKRDGGQGQYSEPLQQQTVTTDCIGELAAYIDAHLAGDLTVESLAARHHLSPRQFSRRFRDAFHVTPATYVRAVRLDRAKQLLGAARCNVSRLADMVGFASDDAFRRAFELRFGVAPRDYRRRFANPSKP